MALYRVKVALSGWAGGPGVMTHYYADPIIVDESGAQLASDTVHNATFAAKGLFPSYMQFKVETQVDAITAANGQAAFSFNIPQVQFAGTGGPSQLPPQVQLCVAWRSDALIEGRRVRGRTFLGPLVPSAQEDNGTPTAGALAIANTYAEDMQDTGVGSQLSHVVYHRPVLGVGGSHHEIISFAVQDKFATLRSRRD